MVFYLFIFVGMWLHSSVRLSEALNPITIDDLKAIRQLHQPAKYNEHFAIHPSNTSTKEPVFIAYLPLDEEAFGGKVGRYLEGVACCDMVGVHFVDVAGIESVSTDPEIRAEGVAFFNAFPTVIMHPDPERNVDLARMRYRLFCPVFRRHDDLPWGNTAGQTALTKRMQQSLQILNTAYDAGFPPASTDTIKRETFDIIIDSTEGTQTALNLPSHLPLIPSAVILFRCLDLVNFDGVDMYGLVNYNVYPHLIPRNATTIYVVTEPLKYLNAANDVAKNICIRLGQALLQHLHKSYPAATVALRRGHAMQSSLMQARAQTVVCAPSSFGLFSVLVNPNRVYFQKSILLPIYPKYTDSIQWIKRPSLINFKNHPVKPGQPEFADYMLQLLMSPVNASMLVHSSSYPYGHWLDK